MSHNFGCRTRSLRRFGAMESLEDVRAGTGRWRNIQDTVRLTIAELCGTVQAQALTIRALEAKVDSLCGHLATTSARAEEIASQCASRIQASPSSALTAVCTLSCGHFECLAPSPLAAANLVSVLLLYWSVVCTDRVWSECWCPSQSRGRE